MALRAGAFGHLHRQCLMDGQVAHVTHVSHFVGRFIDRIRQTVGEGQQHKRDQQQHEHAATALGHHPVTRSSTATNRPYCT